MRIQPLFLNPVCPLVKSAWTQPLRCRSDLAEVSTLAREQADLRSKPVIIGDDGIDGPTLWGHAGAELLRTGWPPGTEQWVREEPAGLCNWKRTCDTYRA